MTAENKNFVNVAAAAGAMPMPSRRTRKQLTMAVLLYCGLVVAYLAIYGGADSRLQETIAWALITLGGLTLTAYTTGAVLDNRLLADTMRKK